MKHLLIIAHGSRREASNHEVLDLAGKVAAQLQLPVGQVKAAFLELAQPSIATALDESFSNGCTEMLVLPYFLASGNHVVSDVPNEVAAAQQRWPDKKITLLPHIGAAPSMVNLIANNYHTKDA
ncbi:CbiX/SirB N-terminal domain-containing protein [Denitrificimonas sp. JX-1]|uniref:CbiX/SirB N-terminal domain-containing protein n=1 Tax=Denitrificimonas halotolerans TaxID=3098930 RepID=A0ABU5GQU7_9GAMM|nr:CbiX/SirB N-terminal domain-containing protein [Denitrificimonas sp. JX-1]MDY7219369.1 CbiX/SirB N-terminal domain-containing protein [Denitrificimonas sp. JX-1]